jgi:SAM-dependent methyltransferase
MSHAPVKQSRHPLKLAWRILDLSLRPGGHTGRLVQASYDRIAAGYDDAWTQHNRGLTLAMLDRLTPPAGAQCVDLACGTGFVTAELSRRTGRRAIGVDASPGMLGVARRQHGDACEFVEADVLGWLRSRPARSADIITCAWALGYSQPWAVIRESARVLRPGGRVGIIDNTLFSLAGVLWTSLQAFSEAPEALAHVMRVWFLPHSAVLASLVHWAGLRVRYNADGAKTYSVPDGAAAIARLTATGAAAGFEFAAAAEHKERVFARFAEILEQRCHTATGIPITHRWLAAIGERP